MSWNCISGHFLSTLVIFILCFIHENGSTCSRRMDCYCGVKRMPTRIVGGHETNPHRYPWMASLADTNLEPFCGGALINDRYILTAAHCLPETTVARVRIILGHHDLKKLREATVLHAERFIYHMRYQDTDPVQKFDIALIKLRERVNFTDIIHPVCLPGKGTPSKDFERLFVAGWGRIGENQITSDRLLEADVPEVSMNDCYRLLHRSRVGPDHICAGNRSFDSCEGDSGGPLMTEVKGRVVQVGLVSWGVACGHRMYPGVFTRISSYARWINEKTPDAKYCNNRKPYNQFTHSAC